MVQPWPSAWLLLSALLYSGHTQGSPECPPMKADIAFLLDGSGSVTSIDFNRIKSFVKELIEPLVERGFKFAVVQYSTRTNIHFDFNTFNIHDWKEQVDQITQLRGETNTAAGIQSVVDDVLSARGGVRTEVKKILIVITDGQSVDRRKLPSAARDADRKSVVRFAIGVGNAFLHPDAKAELEVIASAPPDTHVFQVESFTELDETRNTFQKSIFSFEGTAISPTCTSAFPSTVIIGVCVSLALLVLSVFLVILYRHMSSKTQEPVSSTQSSSRLNTHTGNTGEVSPDYENDPAAKTVVFNPKINAVYQNLHPQTTNQDSLHPQTTNQDSLYQSLDPQTTNQDSLYQSLHPQTTNQDSLYQSLDPQTTNQDSLYQSLHPQTTNQDSLYQSLDPQTTNQDSLYQSLHPQTGP